METVTIKAIEAMYNGFRFRSRLEARWAVVFDILGIEWRYEHEGYQTEGGFYLPDFWLPNTYLRAADCKGVLFEVKPHDHASVHPQLATVATGLNVGGILACGFEWEAGGYGYDFRWHGLYQVAPPYDPDMNLYICECGVSTFEYWGAGNYVCPECGSHDVKRTALLGTDAYNRAIRYRFW